MRGETYKLSRYTVVSDPFCEPGRNTPLRILFSTRSGARLTVSEQTWAALQVNPAGDIDLALRDALIASTMLVPETEDEFAEVLAANKQVLTEDRTLYQVIQPTAACQLGCDYCGQAHSPRTLSEEHLKEILARVEQRLLTGHFDELSIGWFGGEPLLALDVMRQASAQLRDLAKRMNVEYSARLVTNGVRLDEVAQAELHEVHRIRYVEVTLDGDEAAHDARRHWKRTERGSFAAILRNVSTLLKRPAPRPDVGIRCNVDVRNVESVVPLMKTLAEAGLQKLLKRFYVASVYSWGNGASRLALPPLEFASREIVWFAEMARLGFPLELIPQRVHATCMVFKPEAELVDAFGTRFNCSEVSYVPSYTVDGENIYARRDDGRPTRATELATFYDRVARGAYPCNECPMFPVCGGACPKDWLEGGVPCPPPKHNIGQRLILEYALEGWQVQAVDCLGPKQC